MSEQQNPDEAWEMSFQEHARSFSYPPTPDIAASVSKSLRPAPRRRLNYLARAAALLVLMCAALLFVPEIRASVLEFLQIGAIRIIPETPTQSATSSNTLTVFDLDAVATVQEAQEIFTLPLSLPSYPADLGAPDRIFAVSDPGVMLVFVWLVPGTQDQIAMSLYMLRATEGGGKYYPWEPELTSVNGAQAFWLTDVHAFDFYGTVHGETSDWSLAVASNVLIWEVDNVTYRLEIAASLDEAIRIAESLQPITP